ncbi:unnamed protein product [Rhizoctonia solani]|uniref:Uncharacterized protein n=1 Tax=Rhizoctonia solani TaxID=456999 RepID=A0A8H3AG11_9AGAM|nr:unnamed protein product [Rhizoctonia solani]
MNDRYSPHLPPWKSRRVATNSLRKEDAGGRPTASACYARHWLFLHHYVTSFSTSVARFMNKKANVRTRFRAVRVDTRGKTLPLTVFW